MTASRSHRFKAILQIKTLTNYTFSESLINEYYHAILIKRKKIDGFKIQRSFCKSTWLAIFSSLAVGSDLEEEANIAPTF